MVHSELFVCESLNSALGVTGNIGLRTGYVMDVLQGKGIATLAIARQAAPAFADRTIGYGPFAQVPRLLNGYRIYFDRTFDHRRYDNLLYSAFNHAYFPLIKRLCGQRRGVVHFWDNCPEVLWRYKKAGFQVALDVAIAPAKYIQYLKSAKSVEIPTPDLAHTLDLEQRTYPLVDRFIAPSSFVRDCLCEFYRVAPERVAVIPFGVKAKATAAKRSSDNAKQGMDYCFAGNINIRKGMAILLEAIDHPDFAGDRLHLCGRVFPELKALLARQRPCEIITPGFVDTAEYLPNCDAFVFPTLMEGSAKAVYEAMAAGLPVVTTPAAGSLVEEGKHGLIVPVGDVDALRKALLHLKRDRKQRELMGQAAKATASLYPWSRYAEAVVGEYLRMGG